MSVLFELQRPYFASCSCVWDMIFDAFISCPQQGLKVPICSHCGNAVCGKGLRGIGGIGLWWWHLLIKYSLPLGIALRNSTAVCMVRYCMYSAFLYVWCITVTMDFTSVPPCMWKERGKPGISYEDLGADLTFI